MVYLFKLKHLQLLYRDYFIIKNNFNAWSLEKTVVLYTKCIWIWTFQ